MAGDDVPPGLDRHVLPIGATQPGSSHGLGERGGGYVEEVLDSDGFLEPSPSNSWWAPRTVTPRPVTDLIGSPASFVLLAPGGVGKSTVLRQLRREEPEAVEVDLTVLDKSGMSRALAGAIEDGGPVYLVALDVAVRDVPAAFRILARELAVPEARQVRWRLACRPAAWSASLADGLRDALPGFEELTLLPLSRAAAAALAARVGAPDFLDAVVEAKLGRLAASALRMKSAAEQWRRTGRLPESDLAAVEYEINHLLVETSEDVQKRLSEDRRLRIAMRLGAMSIFGGITRFASQAQPTEPGRVHLDSLPSEPEPDQPGTHLGRSDWAEVIDSPLFVAAPAAAAMFCHQQYAEYLAAMYITTRQITRAQVRDLLVVSEAGLVPGALAGVLAWLAAIDPQLVDDLVPANAMALAQTGVEIPSDGVRARVVSALLDQAADGDIDLDWGLDLRGLAYPGLEAALLMRLAVGVTRAEELVWISWVAEAGRCGGRAEPLLREALSCTHTAWARRAAAVACGVLADDSVLARLEPLLRLDADEDPDDELLAAAVDAMYPRLIGTRELIDVLRPRRNTDLVGAYLVLLGQLGDRLASNDLALMIAWATGQVAAGEHAYGRLIPLLLVRGWEHADLPDVLDGLAGLLSALVRNEDWRWPDYGQSPPWQDGDADRRRRLAALVADRLDEHQSYELVDDLALIADLDFDWMMAELPQLPGNARAVLAECVPYLLRKPSARHADVILALPEDHPAYAATEHYRATVSLESEHAQRSQQARRRELDSEARRGPLNEEMREGLTEALAAAAKDIAAWWKVASALACERNFFPSPIFTHDLTKRAGWELLTPDERQRVFDIGVQYVLSHEVGLPAGYGVDSVIIAEVLPDWSGVYLLTTLTRHAPHIIRSLKSPVWANWAPVIVSAWNSDTDAADASLRGDLIDLAPPEPRHYLANAAVARLDAYQEHNRSFTERAVFERLISEIATKVGDRIATGAYDGELANGLLGLLIEEVPEVALPTCARIRAGDLSTLTQLARRGQAQMNPDVIVDELVATNADAEDLIAIVPSLAILDLDDRRLSQLARLLLDRFPYEDDPDWTPHEHGPPGARRARTAALEELATRGASQSLVALRAGRPDLEQSVIGRYIRNSRTQAANLAFIPVDPKDLLTLLGRADARLVRTDADLLRVVIENLRELQHEMTNSFRDVWNCIDGKWAPKSEDDISDWVQRNLRARLTTGSIVGREVQVNRPGSGGIGTRIDLAATSVTATHPISTAQVIIEAKVINHSKLMTAMVDQLAQQYLVPTRVNHGIYLVYWVSPEQRPSTWTRRDRDDRDAVMRALERQASDLGSNVTIRPFLLDISRPD